MPLMFYKFLSSCYLLIYADLSKIQPGFPIIILIILSQIYVYNPLFHPNFIILSSFNYAFYTDQLMIMWVSLVGWADQPISSMLFWQNSEIMLVIKNYTYIENNDKLTHLNYIAQYNSMGQSYCQNCCGVKNNQLNNSLQQFKNIEGDAPEPKFAKSVKQFIQVNPRIKQIFIRERNPHITERKGSKLPLFYLFSYAAYYDGEWKNGLPHGAGRLIYDDGSIYEGCFKEGFAECRNALFIKDNGNYYKGQVRMNKAQGQGVLTTDKMVYRGQWQNDLPNGQGHEVYNRISYYLGNFQCGKKNGIGHYQWNQSDYYEGGFKDNKIHGFGRHVTKQYEYQGNFEQGQKNGQGRLVNLIKRWEYNGQFKNNKMHGKGTYKWDDGTMFIGQFEQNQKIRGKLVTTSGEIVQQSFT